MYLSAKQAAARLGVSVSTIYAYVSRKGIRSARVPGSKIRLYWEADIESLRGAPNPPGEVLAGQTAITLLTSEGHFYRGHDALRLSETATLEDVCKILWDGPIPGFEQSVSKQPRIYPQLMQHMTGGTITEKLAALLPVLERSNPRAHDISPAGFRRSGIDILAWFASLMCERDHPVDRPFHLQIAEARNAGAPYADLIRQILVLCADHELDPSTYAVRAIANSGASPYQTVVGGLASAGGRRLPFGRMRAMSQMLTEIITGPDPAEPILSRLREGEPVCGFGSTIYANGDPRARFLLASMRGKIGDDPAFRRLERAIEAAAEAMLGPPDLMILVCFVGHKLAFTGQEGLLLRFARVAGWIAHAIEQYHGQNLVRSRSTYVGELPEREGRQA